MTGVVRVASSVLPKPSWSLSTTAKSPLPPVVLSPPPGLSNTQPLPVPALPVDHPAGACQVSKVCVDPA
jgi:hypothetical protein